MNLLPVEDGASSLKVGKSTVWELSRSDPTFPKPIKLSDRITRWLESDLEDWVLRHKQGEVQ